MTTPRVRTWVCGVPAGEEYDKEILATTRGRAKAEYWRGIEDAWPGYPYTRVRCRVASGREPDVRTVDRGLNYIREHYCRHDLILRRRVTIRGQRGVIVGATGSYVEVLLDSGRRVPVHPSDVITGQRA